MPRSPRFLPLWGRRKTRGERIDRLKGVIHANLSLVFRPDEGTKLRAENPADYKQNTIESGLSGIGHRVVEQGFPLRSERVQLFKAAVAGAQARRENDQG